LTLYVKTGLSEQFYQSAAITLFAFAGMIAGFRLQSELQTRNEAELARRVDEEFERRIAVKVREVEALERELREVGKAASSSVGLR
jgi:hypothetical protein